MIVKEDANMQAYWRQQNKVNQSFNVLWKTVLQSGPVVLLRIPDKRRIGQLYKENKRCRRW